MNASRKGTSLKIEIRLALSALKRPTDIRLGSKSIAELEQIKSALIQEIKAVAPPCFTPR